MNPPYKGYYKVWEQCARDAEKAAEFSKGNDISFRFKRIAKECWENARMYRLQEQPKSGWEILRDKLDKDPAYRKKREALQDKFAERRQEPKPASQVSISMEDYLLHKDNLTEFFKDRNRSECSTEN